MSTGLLAAVAIAYLYVGYDYLSQGRIGMALAFAAYACANTGFILDLMERAK